MLLNCAILTSLQVLTGSTLVFLTQEVLPGLVLSTDQKQKSKSKQRICHLLATGTLQKALY